MARRGLTRREIYSTAEAIAALGIIPTQSLIRDKLGTGSHATIAKYLKAWKEQKLLSKDLAPIKANQNKVLELEELLRKQTDLAHNLAQEQINLQKQYLNLELEKEQLSQVNTSQANLVQTLTLEVANLKILLTELKKERQAANEVIIKDKNKTIEQLNLELNKIHSTSLELIRDTSVKGHDLLMEVKVANINLEAKLNEQTKKNMQLTKYLQEQQLLQIRSEQKISLYEKKLLELLDKTEIANLGIK